MIITRQKSFDSILSKTRGYKVFLIGCSECATLSNTGGEKEVLEMKKNLEENGAEVTGYVILEPACHLLNAKRLLRLHREGVDEADRILVLACGNGVQTVSDALPDKTVIPGLDTLFLGEIIHLGEFEKRCIQCGECILDEFNNLCPLARCPKQMLNGPCGGSQDGRCEVNKDMECVWARTYRVMIENNRVEDLKRIIPPKDWSRTLEYKVVTR